MERPLGPPHGKTVSPYLPPSVPSSTEGLCRKLKLEAALANMTWEVKWEELHFPQQTRVSWVASRSSLTSMVGHLISLIMQLYLHFPPSLHIIRWRLGTTWSTCYLFSPS
ncbi:hypothetical protein LAZ67_22002073 [Cordylochernes scorpioides]|uniref:Uncharacterized protein n=1 Tax=Cordylochernes scorpioides TaxID=51811 RepID=A0ABY6LPQ5_9ARAC|nr:hypothetical protein LAZ67_22002073 [Cordylochernes scorpioides]